MPYSRIGLLFAKTLGGPKVDRVKGPACGVGPASRPAQPLPNICVCFG